MTATRSSSQTPDDHDLVEALRTTTVTSTGQDTTLEEYANPLAARLALRVQALEAQVTKLRAAGQTHPISFGGQHPTDNRLRPFWLRHAHVEHERIKVMDRMVDVIQDVRARPTERTGRWFTAEEWLDRLCDAVVYAVADRCGVPLLVCRCGADPLAAPDEESATEPDFEAMGYRMPRRPRFEHLHEYGCPNAPKRVAETPAEAAMVAPERR